MRCSDCRESLSAYLDHQLSADRAADVRQHLDGCADCAREHDALASVSRSLKEHLVRYPAPAHLESRIRDAIGESHTSPLRQPERSSRPWTYLAAAGLIIAAASSALTFAITRRAATTRSVASEVVSSHIRSLMPGHLTDVASNNLHNVKPWFAGRTNLSPAVPLLDSAGFPLVGGRLDYIDGRSVAAIVYTRRQHVINVYSWPESGADIPPTRETDSQGYHLVYWKRGGVESWAISDVDPPELDRFATLFR